MRITRWLRKVAYKLQLRPEASRSMTVDRCTLLQAGVGVDSRGWISDHELFISPVGPPLHFVSEYLDWLWMCSMPRETVSGRPRWQDTHIYACRWSAGILNGHWSTVAYFGISYHTYDWQCSVFLNCGSNVHNQLWSNQKPLDRFSWHHMHLSIETAPRL
jgi:hypothetical protein